MPVGTRTVCDTKERTGYSLVVAKKGPRLKEVKPNDPNERCCWSYDNSSITARYRSMTWLAEALSKYVQTTVVDKTGLTGVYDFTLQFDPRRADANPDSTATTSLFPDLFVAVQEQLGLRLEREKLPLEILAIEHAEKPSDN